MIEDGILFNGKKYEVCIESGNQFDYMSRGFRFADRRMILEIGLQDFKPSLKCKLGINFDIRILTKEIAEDIYKIAEKSFEYDRRFAIDYAMKDSELKNICLRRYMDRLVNGVSYSNKVLLCIYEDCIIGFLIFRKDEICTEIILASMSEAYKKLGIGFFMYSYLLENLKENGIKKVRSKIFTSNIDSLNLHIRLGSKSIKVKGYEDWYIREEHNV
jgi:hypothetical protein